MREWKILLLTSQGLGAPDGATERSENGATRRVMQRELLLHLLFLVILLALGGIRLWYYRIQRRGMGLMALKKQETLNDLRQIGAIVASLLIVAHILSPGLLAWTEFPLFIPVRWVGAALATVAVAASWFAARDDLVVAQRTSRERFEPPGLFRWTRHPLELVLVVVALGLTVLSANWVVALIAAVWATHEVLVRAPRTERARRARFGESYDAYARVTPAFLPRPPRPSSTGAREHE